MAEDVALLQRLEGISITEFVMHLQLHLPLEYKVEHCARLALFDDLSTLFEKLFLHVILDLIVELLVQKGTEVRLVKVIYMLQKCDLEQFPVVSILFEAVLFHLHQNVREACAQVVESFFP